METTTLTPKQQRFCEEYLIDLNGTQAALRAGYTESMAMGGALLSNPLIQEQIAIGAKRNTEKFELTQDMVLRELMKIAFSDLTHYYDADLMPKNIADLSPNARAALSCIVTHRTYSETNAEGRKKIRESIRIKTHDKLKALNMLYKHCQLAGAKAAVTDEMAFLKEIDPEDWDFGGSAEPGVVGGEPFVGNAEPEGVGREPIAGNTETPEKPGEPRPEVLPAVPEPVAIAPKYYTDYLGRTLETEETDFPKWLKAHWTTLPDEILSPGQEAGMTPEEIEAHNQKFYDLKKKAYIAHNKEQTRLYAAKKKAEYLAAYPPQPHPLNRYGKDQVICVNI